MSNGQPDRAERLAAALRDNLRRRKAQARATPPVEDGQQPINPSPSVTDPSD